MRVLDQLCTKLGWVWFTLSSLNALENEPPIAMSMAILKSFVSKESHVFFNIRVSDYEIGTKILNYGVATLE